MGSRRCVTMKAQENTADMCTLTSAEEDGQQLQVFLPADCSSFERDLLELITRKKKSSKSEHAMTTLTNPAETFKIVFFRLDRFALRLINRQEKRDVCFMS